MQILLAFIVGAAIGIAVHYVARDRGTRGVALAPVLGALVSGLVWMILTWIGLGLQSPWLWLSALVAPIVIVFPSMVMLARARLARDAAERARLKIA